MDFLSLMILSEPDFREKYVFFVKKVYQRLPSKRGEILENFSVETKRFELLMNFFYNHPSVVKSLGRMRHYKGNVFILPVIYDHLLARSWYKISTISLQEYMNKIIFKNEDNKIPYKAERTIIRFRKTNILMLYKSIDGIVKINEDFHKINDYAFGKSMENFADQYAEYQNDFSEYLIDFMELVRMNELISIDSAKTQFNQVDCF